MILRFLHYHPIKIPKGYTMKKMIIVFSFIMSMACSSLSAIDWKKSLKMQHLSTDQKAYRATKLLSLLTTGCIVGALHINDDDHYPKQMFYSGMAIGTLNVATSIALLIRKKDVRISKASLAANVAAFSLVAGGFLGCAQHNEGNLNLIAVGAFYAGYGLGILKNVYDGYELLTQK